MPDEHSMLRRFRFGLRSLFVLVTVICVGLVARELMQRRTTYLKQAKRHDAYALAFSGSHEGQKNDDYYEAFSEYHRQISEKYARAAKYSWLPVESDPPEPVDPLYPEFTPD